jgi:WD40 repeat protein
VCQLQYSISGDQFWCATGSARAKLYDREGRELAHFVKGDMYIQDLTHTNGHVASLTSGSWHPKDRHRLMTASIDGTIRLWDVNKKEKNLNVLKLKSRFAGKRCGVSACTFSPDASIIAGGRQRPFKPFSLCKCACLYHFDFFVNVSTAGTDGSIHIWNATGRVMRETKSVLAAHDPTDIGTSSIIIHPNNQTLVSRGGDHTLKVLHNLSPFRNITN